MQREGDGGGVDGRDVDAKNRLSGGRLRPMPRRRRWLLAVLEDLIGERQNLSLLVSYSPLGALNLSTLSKAQRQNAGHEPLAVMLQP